MNRMRSSVPVTSWPHSGSRLIQSSPRGRDTRHPSLWDSVLYRRNARKDQVAESHNADGGKLDKAYNVCDVLGTEPAHIISQQ
jgi:hypothetical protein